MSLVSLAPSLVLPFSDSDIQRAIRANGWKTPFHLYSEATIRRTTSSIQAIFWKYNFDFKNHFAVKALPNPHILKILQKNGMGMDCSSILEIHLAQKVGVKEEGIMFTSNNTTVDEFREAKEAGAIINLDDITHIEKLEQVGFPDIVCCRYNPGQAKEGNSIIGESIKQKYGMRKDQIIDAYWILKKKWVKRFGLHAMMVSNERNEQALIENARLLFQLAKEIFELTGVTFEFINLGGGIGVPYKPDDHEVDLDIFVAGIQKEYDTVFNNNRIGLPKIFMENGRYITGPAWALITRVQNVVEKYQKFVGVDASMNALMRPGMYGAYHHITAIGKEHLPHDLMYHVTWSLCENNDQFTAGNARALPLLEEGDILAIHTSGAHGHSMGFNYNAKLRPAEILLQIDGTLKIIRREETENDLNCTITSI